MIIELDTDQLVELGRPLRDDDYVFVPCSVGASGLVQSQPERSACEGEGACDSTDYVIEGETFASGDIRAWVVVRRFEDDYGSPFEVSVHVWDPGHSTWDFDNPVSAIGCDNGDEAREVFRRECERWKGWEKLPKKR